MAHFHSSSPLGPHAFPPWHMGCIFPLLVDFPSDRSIRFTPDVTCGDSDCADTHGRALRVGPRSTEPLWGKDRLDEDGAVCPENP